MATVARPPAQADAASDRWYALSADDAAQRLGVDPTAGLSAAQAADLLSSRGPNALPAEKPTPGWRRFIDQYRSYMQLILCGAAIVSLVVQEWSTARSEERRVGKEWSSRGSP